MPRPVPDIPIRISAIPGVGNDRSVTVTIAASGKTIRVPRNHVDFAPGHVLVPLWLYRRLAKSKILVPALEAGKGINHGKESSECCR